MATEKHGATYRRRGSEGTLKLAGVMDIFEAGPFHGAAVKAFEDSAAKSIKLDLSEVERLDVSAVQIVAALRRDLEAAGRSISVVRPSDRVSQQLERAGVLL